ncbi:unnamed protein product [Sympodiomycopsis kandeliae]
MSDHHGEVGADSDSQHYVDPIADDSEDLPPLPSSPPWESATANDPLLTAPSSPTLESPSRDSLSSDDNEITRLPRPSSEPSRISGLFAKPTDDNNRRDTMSEEYFPVSNPAVPRQAAARPPSWAGAPSRREADSRSPPLGSPHLDSTDRGISEALTPPLTGTRNSRYSAIPSSEYDAITPSEGGTLPWTSRGEFSSAASYSAFNGKSRPNSMNSSHLLGRDYDSVAGLNVPLDKYEDGSWDRTPPAEQHPRHAHLAKFGVGSGATKKRKCILITIIMLIVLIIIIAVAVPVAVVLSNKDSSDNSSKSATTQTDGTGHGVDGKVLTTGHDGSVIDLGNGTSFTYVNKHGGFWVSDFFNDSAQAQSYTKPLSEEWDWANDRMFGVNLGGWLVTEPFIAPNLYEPYEFTDTPAVDEYTLSQRYLSEGGAANLEKKMRDHYDTFITEKDFADIAGAGLNWIRLPFGFWALETQEDEPFLAKVSWEYVLKAIQWARKYGLRINLDLHAVPGGQNTYNHSGRLRYMAWMTGAMGIVNAQRTLNYIRAVTEYISQPEIRKVVPLFSVLNEPNLPLGIGSDQLKSFYGEVYNMVRNITGTGAGNGPMIGFHDGFMGVDQFNNFLTNSDRVAYDTHPYICFTGPYSDSYDDGVKNVCNTFTQNTDKALANHGAYLAGEWSLAINDCGQYLNNVGEGTRYEGTYPGSTQKYGDCEKWVNWQAYSQDTKDNMKKFALAQMNSLRNFFFWTWHIGYSTRTNNTINPSWNYKLGLQEGWMPTNINDVVASGCSSAASTSWKGSFQPWQTGHADSYQVTLASNNQWPPATISSGGTGGPSSMTIPASSLPTLAQNSPIFTVPNPTYSASYKNQPIATVGAWFNSNDKALMYGYPDGCPHVDPYYNGSSLPPGYPCGGNNGRRDLPQAARATPAALPTSTPTPAP